MNYAVTNSIKKSSCFQKRRAGSAFSVVLLTILILAAIGAAAYGYYILNLETFYTGVVVDNVELGGMTYAQGLKTIMELGSRNLTLSIFYCIMRIWCGSLIIRTLAQKSTLKR